MTDCVRRGYIVPEKAKFGGQLQQKHEITNCSQTVSLCCHLASTNKGLGWICHSDTVFCQIIVISFYLKTCLYMTFRVYKITF